MKRSLLLFLTMVAMITAALILIDPSQGQASAMTMSSQAGLVKTSSEPLNIRAAAGSGSPLLAQAAKGSYITLIGRSGNWWKVEYASGSYGYAYAAYIRVVPQAQTAVINLNNGCLNVRCGPAASYAVKTTLANGKTVLVLSAANGWSRILYNGKETGYVDSQYLAAGTVWPVPTSAKINRYFISGSHLGLDIAPAAKGVPGNSVLSMLAGTVVYSGWLGDYGYVIYINSYYNGQYIQTRYAHLENPPFYACGDQVIAGQTIGAMGSTGDSSGVHLHFEVRIRNNSGSCIANTQSTPVNPFNYVKP